MQSQLFEYDYDEEALGFGPPLTPRAEPRAPRAALERTGQSLAALGLLSLLVQSFGGPLAGTWLGVASSLGLSSLGAALAFVAHYAGRSAATRTSDDTWFRSLRSRGLLGWCGGLVMTALYVVLYWYPELLGHSERGAPTGLVRVVDPLSRALTGSPATQWFLYGVLYSLAVVVFGVRVWARSPRDRYQRVRTLSVCGFQVVFAWFLPNLLVRFRQPYLELNGLWPLKYDYLLPGKVGEFESAGAIGSFLLAWSLVLALVATPVLTYFFGKRWYCSWVCGCGGLAETLGDPFRHLSSKTAKAWRLERYLIHAVLALVLVMSAAVWAHHALGWFPAAGALKEWYGFYIGAVFSGVVGVGFYPLLGSRVWCRFGCPQAALLGILQRLFSRFRVTTNGGQCISCGSCSTYCEMGIDVRAYAQRGEDIVRASCVGCGVCAEVCPRGVLRLENGPPAERFRGSDLPLDVLRDSFTQPSIQGYEPWPRAQAEQPEQPD
jgi:ferredoxin-type protein NapH